MTVRMLPWPSRPPRAVIAERHPPEAVPVDVRNPVVPRQPLVDERVVRPSAGPRRCDPRAAGFRRTARSRAGTPRAGCRRTPETASDPARRPHDCAATATGRRSCPPAPSTRGSAQHAPHLLLEHRRLLELAAARHVEQLVVRNAAPQKERQPRRQLEVADPIGARRGALDRIAFEAEQEVRIAEDALDERAGCRRRSFLRCGPAL